MWPRASASPEPLNVSWYVTNASNTPIDGAWLTIWNATSASGTFLQTPSSVVEDKIANAFQNPITTGWWNPAHPHGMAVADLQITSVSSYYFYVEVHSGTYVWYWPIASSYKPGDLTWHPVTASGSPSGYAASGNGFGNGPSTAYPTQQPPVLHPGISVTKTGPTCAHEGDTITYTITVTNPSSTTTMYRVSVSDSLLHDLTTSFSASLAPGASDLEAFTYHVPTPSGDITNTVTVEYTDGLNTKTDTASRTVDILHPAIHVAKSDPTNAHEGDLITYTITVTNTGDCPLSSVSVTDPTLSFSWTGVLDKGETKTLYASYTIPHPSTVIINTVTASGSDTQGGTVSDIAVCSVTVLHPGIHVTKTADKTVAHEGDTIKYTITVRNTGDCPLSSVSLSDTLLGSLTGHLPDTTLIVGEVDTFTVNYVVPAHSTVISNTVTASGSDPLIKSVSDSASSTVTVTAPPPSVGGEWAPITLQTLSPLNTLQLLALWIALASMAAIAGSFVAIRRIKKRQN
jgi:uncharacterized repeat protein (TIGR01451 family)/fimbrial isopeptide formation D2 family protein